MPFVRTAVRKGTSAETKTAIVHGVHDALVTAIGMPPDELFNFVQEYDPADFFYDRKFNRIARSDHLVVVEITMRRGRSDAMKNTRTTRSASLGRSIDILSGHTGPAHFRAAASGWLGFLNHNILYHVHTVGIMANGDRQRIVRAKCGYWIPTVAAIFRSSRERRWPTAHRHVRRAAD